MPALTRSAARQLPSENVADTARLALREPVTCKAAAVWKHRENVDIFTKLGKKETAGPQVDHNLEIQLADLAVVRAFVHENGIAHSIETRHAIGLIRDAINGLANLNVTSTKVNQSKRGPFTAALNRVRDDRLRTVQIQQMVRQGRGKWMLDNGVWANIETAVVNSYDQMDERLRGGGVDAVPAAGNLVESTMDELKLILCKMGLQ